MFTTLSTLLTVWLLCGASLAGAFEIQPRSQSKSGFPAPSGAPLTAEEYDNALFGLAALGLARGSTQTLPAGGQIDCRSNAIVPVAGSGGPVTLSSSPQLLPPTDLPVTKLCIVEGTSATNTVTVVDGNGVELHGSNVTLGLRTLLPLVYNGSQWVLLTSGGGAGRASRMAPKGISPSPAVAPPGRLRRTVSRWRAIQPATMWPG